ncbi:MAG TPA: type II secretion system F family protein [Candidatus Acidoferrum sp.]|nr:type II secretion system F family protein [Candidatus Acidoferrum sp.]
MTATLDHKSQLYHQLYVGIKSGLPLHVLANALILPPTLQSRQAAMLPRLLEKGRPLSSALAYAKVITPWEAAIIKIGEDAGRLDGVLADLETFFVARNIQYKETRSKLIYPALTFVVAVIAGPLPALAAGKISAARFLVGALLKCALLYAVYRVLIVRSFEQASAGAVSPLLTKLALRVHPDHWLRQMFEVAYLNLLILCLGSGIDAVSALRMMQGLMPGNRLFQQHIIAINQIDSRGVTLTQALVGSGIVLNHELGSFLNNSEKSGTLHSDLKQYLARRNGEMQMLLRHKMKQLASWLYALVLLAGLLAFVAGQGGTPPNPFTPTVERVQAK